MQGQAQAPKHEYFLQIPHIIIDSELKETHILGFIRFLRKCRRGIFSGSIRELGRLLGMARMTVARMLPEWVRAGWVAKRDAGDEICLKIMMDDIWEQNSAQYATKEGDTTGPNWATTGPNWATTGPNWATTGPIWATTGPIWATNERDSGCNIDSNIITNRDSNICDMARSDDAPHITLSSSLDNDVSFSSSSTPDNVVSPEAVSPLAAPSTRHKPTRAKKASSQKKDIFADVKPEVQAVIHEWQGIFKRPIPLTETLLKHATTLAAFQPVAGEIAACRLWMYQVDKKGWYSTHGMHLGDVAREFEKFRSLGSVPVIDPSPGTRAEPGQPPARPSRMISSFDDPNYDASDEFYPSEQEKAERRARANGQG